MDLISSPPFWDCFAYWRYTDGGCEQAVFNTLTFTKDILQLLKYSISLMLKKSLWYFYFHFPRKHSFNGESSVCFWRVLSKLTKTPVLGWQLVICEYHNQINGSRTKRCHLNTVPNGTRWFTVRAPIGSVRTGRNFHEEIGEHQMTSIEFFLYYQLHRVVISANYFFPFSFIVNSVIVTHVFGGKCYLIS